MEKRVISEINQMKYLVNYKAGRVISEQIFQKEDDVDSVFSTQDPKLASELKKLTLFNLRNIEPPGEDYD